MNREALEAAVKAHLGEEDWCALIKLETAAPGMVAAALRDMARAIEVYLAALPDEDGLVKVLRDQATIADERRRGGMAVLLGEAADALEAARARLEMVRGLYQEAAQLVEHGGIPKGWRLVPEEPTKEMCRLGGATQMAQDYKRLVEKAGEHLLDGTPNEGKPVTAPIHDMMIALVCYRAMLAVAPEPPETSDD